MTSITSLPPRFVFRAVACDWFTKLYTSDTSPRPWAQLVNLLKPVDKCWQPQDLLPNPESKDFLDEVPCRPQIPFPSTDTARPYDHSRANDPSGSGMATGMRSARETRM